MRGLCLQLVVVGAAAPHVERGDKHARLEGKLVAGGRILLAGALALERGTLDVLGGVVEAAAVAHLARLVLDQRSALEGVLVVLAADALAVAGAEDARLEALAVLFEAARLFARAPLHVVLGVLLQRLRLFELVERLGGQLTGGLARKLGSEGVRRALECLRDSSLSGAFVVDVVLAWVAVAPAGDAVEPTRKALTVQLQALAVPTIATTELLGRRGQTRLVVLVGVEGDIVGGSVEIWEDI